MCTYQTERVSVSGSGKGASGWFPLTSASVYLDHPVHAPAAHTLNVDFINPEQGPSARVGSRARPRLGPLPGGSDLADAGDDRGRAGRIKPLTDGWSGATVWCIFRRPAGARSAFYAVFAIRVQSDAASAGQASSSPPLQAAKSRA